MENIEHHLIQGQIAKAIENLFSNKAFRASAQDAQKDYQLPENLVDAIVSRNDDREWEYFFTEFERVSGRYKADGSHPEHLELPLEMQSAIINRVRKGKVAEIKRYIKMMPFDKSLHAAFWQVCRKKYREIIDEYVERYPLEDAVLDRYWQNSSQKQREHYLIHNAITRTMAKKMWCAKRDKEPQKWAEFYLQYHTVPDGVVEDLYKDVPYVVDIIDLVDFSTKPFSEADERFIVENLGKDRTHYVKKFGLKPNNQLLMLRSKNKSLIRCFIDAGWVFDLGVQHYMLEPEFLKDGGKELLAHYLSVEPEPFGGKELIYEERLRNLFN